MAATDPTASDIGHGTLGLRDNLRPFAELVNESAGQKHVIGLLLGAKLVGGWEVYSGNTYRAPVVETFDGLSLLPIGVRVFGSALAHQDTVTRVIANAGSCVFEEPFLYVHLADNSDPNLQDVMVKFGFYFSNVAMELPSLGVDMYSGGNNGGFETWLSTTNADIWVEEAIGAGGGSANQDAAIVAPDGGAYSCRFDGPFNASGGFATKQTKGGPSASFYSLSGWYRTDAANSASITARIQVEFDTNRWAKSDGRNYATSDTWIDLAPTYGEWRRFVFHFIFNGTTAGASTRYRVGAYNSSGGALNGSVWFDGVKLYAIQRWSSYAPALALDSVPSREVQRADRFFGRWSVGLGTLTILNTGGRLESMFGSFDFLQQECVVRIGGRFPDGGNEILFEDLFGAYLGLTSGPHVNDSQGQVELQDLQGFWTTLIPRRTYSKSETPDLADVDNGRARPLVFGTKTHAKPARVGLGIIPAGALGLGSFEVMEPAYNIAGGFQDAPTAIYAYIDQQSADAEDVNRRVTLAAADWTWNGTACRIEIQRNPGPIVIAGKRPGGSANTVPVILPSESGYNDALDFKYGLGPSFATAFITPGVYTAETLRAEIQAQMRAQTGAANVDVTLGSATANTITIAYSGPGVFELLLSTGANKQRSIFPTIGYSGTADLTGAVSYVGDPVPDTWRLGENMRADIRGYTDDGAGTYTKLGNGPIILGSDIFRFLLHKVLGFPEEYLDLISFDAARTTGPQVLAVYLGAIGEGAVEFGEVVQRLENSIGHDLLLDGGIFRLRQRTSSVPASMIDLYDRDFLSFEAWYDAEDVFSLVRVAYDQDPSTSQWKTSEKSSAAAELRYGRPHSKTFETYLALTTDAIARRDAFYAEATTAPIRYSFEVKGKCLRSVVGDVLRLNRANMLGGTGKVVRIQKKRDDMQTWVSSIEAVEVIAAAAAGVGSRLETIWPPPTGTFDGAWDMGGI